MVGRGVKKMNKDAKDELMKKYEEFEEVFNNWTRRMEKKKVVFCSEKEWENLDNVRADLYITLDCMRED